MKKSLVTSAVALCLSGLALPAVASAATADTTTQEGGGNYADRAQQAARDIGDKAQGTNWGSNLGWLGLIGLAGLAGLKGRHAHESHESMSRPGQGFRRD
ncbi:MAG: WGxxGxxG-CTERM domain-containing protein, partial [Polyangiaceae bacterium]|nr:WGxxGxxG-CTERM domain-containing protein [Polyangiaceae bacterium]